MTSEQETDEIQHAYTHGWKQVVCTNCGAAVSLRLPSDDKPLIACQCEFADIPPLDLADALDAPQGDVLADPDSGEWISHPWTVVDDA